MTSLWESLSPRKTKSNNILSSEFPFATSPEKHTPKSVKKITGSINELHIYDAKVCECSLESTLVLMNNIKQGKSQQKRWILMVLLDGCIVSSDFKNDLFTNI
eukprot:13344673-Ditylum_brightwellii.AAC.1